MILSILLNAPDKCYWLYNYVLFLLNILAGLIQSLRASIKLFVIQVLLISKKLKALMGMPSELRADGSFESSPCPGGRCGGWHMPVGSED